MKKKNLYLILLTLMVLMSVIFVPASAQPMTPSNQAQNFFSESLSNPSADHPYEITSDLTRLQFSVPDRSRSMDMMSSTPTEDGGGARWSRFHYLFIPGVAFLPRDSSTNWNYGGDGCIYTTTPGAALFTHKVNLPVNSRIDYVRIYYYDTSASNSTSWLTAYNGSGGLDDLTSVNSSGSGGYDSSLSPYLGHIYNEFYDAYVLNWQATVNTSAMQLCGFRIAYRILENPVYIPLILK